MKRIVFFSGNRAEFGIMLPIIAELSKKYKTVILFSGAHVLPPWNTYEESIRQLNDFEIKCETYRIELPEKDSYTNSLARIYSESIEFFRKNEIDFAFALGDRIESLGFVLGAFYSRVPLFHICGGDVVQVANYDTNARHAITKLSNYHLVTSERSKDTVLQLGEEEERVVNIGNPSFDYERLGFLTKKDKLANKYGIMENDVIGILTYHPSAGKTAAENFKDFMEVYEGCVSSSLTRILITYPNNDPGHNYIVDYLENCPKDERIRIVKSLGTINYLGIMKEYKTIILGNSSSGLLETLYFQTPVVNIGDRQNGRIHGKNVIQSGIEKNEIRETVDLIVGNYKDLQKDFYEDRFLFGDGKAAKKVMDYMASIENCSREEQLFKKFVVRN